MTSCIYAVITWCRLMPEGADGHPALLLRKKKQVPILAWRQEQLRRTALAVHHASSHTEKELGGARDSRVRITVQL